MTTRRFRRSRRCRRRRVTFGDITADEAGALGQLELDLEVDRQRAHLERPAQGQAGVGRAAGAACRVNTATARLSTCASSCGSGRTVVTVFPDGAERYPEQGIFQPPR